MIRSFAKAAVLVSAIALLAACEETKSSAGDAEPPKATASASTVAIAATTPTVSATASAPAETKDAGAEPKDAGNHDGGAKPSPKK